MLSSAIATSTELEQKSNKEKDMEIKQRFCFYLIKRISREYLRFPDTGVLRRELTRIAMRK